MTDAPHDLQGFLALGWQRLARGVADRRAAARHPVLSTVDPEGWADARTVVLRAASAESALLAVHTDAASPKCAALARDPRCALLVWDARASLQLRLRARAEIHVGDPEAWARVPPAARLVYGGTPPPGHRLDDPDDHAPGGSRPDRFAVLALHLHEIDLLHLGRDRHRRARYRRSDAWRGDWIAP